MKNLPETVALAWGGALRRKMPGSLMADKRKLNETTNIHR